MGDGGNVKFTAVKDDCGHDHHARGHSHDHGHDHAHGGLFHHHPPAVSNIKIALLLNFTFSLVEIAGGFWTGSVAILSDAVHDLGDSLALAVAYVMERMAGKRANARYSYGYRRMSLLSALLTCGFLIAAAIGVLVQAIPRLKNPVMPNTGGMLAFAVLGIAVNGYGAYRLNKGKTLNERVVSWHLIEDLVGWVSVLIGASVMHFVDAPIIDPLLSIGLTIFILYRVLGSLRQTLGLFLQATPDGIDLDALRTEVAALPGVRSTHDAHMWSLDGESHVLTMHVVIDAALTMKDMEGLKAAVRRLAAQRGKVHTTVELESELEDCTVDCVGAKMP